MIIGVITDEKTEESCRSTRVWWFFFDPNGKYVKYVVLRILTIRTDYRNS